MNIFLLKYKALLHCYLFSNIKTKQKQKQMHIIKNQESNYFFFCHPKGQSG